MSFRRNCDFSGVWFAMVDISSRVHTHTHPMHSHHLRATRLMTCLAVALSTPLPLLLRRNRVPVSERMTAPPILYHIRHPKSRRRPQVRLKPHAHQAPNRSHPLPTRLEVVRNRKSPRSLEDQEYTRPNPTQTHLKYRLLELGECISFLFVLLPCTSIEFILPFYPFPSRI